MTAKTTLQSFVNQNNCISVLIIVVEHSILLRSHRGAIGRAAERASRGQGEEQGVGRDAFAGGKREDTLGQARGRCCLCLLSSQ